MARRLPRGFIGRFQRRRARGLAPEVSVQRIRVVHFDRNKIVYNLKLVMEKATRSLESKPACPQGRPDPVEQVEDHFHDASPSLLDAAINDEELRREPSSSVIARAEHGD